MKKHSVIITGHATSFSLEPEFWNYLKQIAAEKQISLAHLIEQIDNSRQTNLSSAIRVYVLKMLAEKVIQNKQAE